MAAGVLFNFMVAVSHIPWVVNTSVESGALHYFVHLLLFASAMAMWLPVCGPIPELHMREPGKMVYLFLMSVVPTVPGGFLTFAQGAVYSAYDHDVRLWGIGLQADQQAAGLIMKLVGGMYLWTWIGVLFFRWAGAQQRANTQLAGGDHGSIRADCGCFTGSGHLGVQRLELLERVAMIDLRLVRTDYDAVQAALARRGIDLSELEQVAALDEQHRNLTTERDAVRHQVKELSQQVGQLKRDRRDAEANAMAAESRQQGEQEKALAADADAVAAQVRELLLRIPNLPAAEAPDGADAADNPVLRVENFDPDAYGKHQRVPHLGVLSGDRVAGHGAGGQAVGVQVRHAAGTGGIPGPGLWCSSGSTATPTATRRFARPPWSTAR